jgi:predicted dehydrogenase
MKCYKIALIGLGSIACRHIKNIDKVLTKRNISYTIDLIRRKNSGKAPEKIRELINRTYICEEEVPEDYDIIFITNPTFLHYRTIKDYVSKTRHMFIEKPVFNNTELSVDSLKLKKNAVYYVACPLRYTKTIQYLKENTDLNRVRSIRVICSSYLPDWRPGTDYRKTYSASEEQGGGVAIDLIHEWDYIRYLFGTPRKTYNIKGKYSHLEIDSDDLSVYIAQYSDKLAEVHLDYFGRKPIREIQIFTEDETIIADIINSRIKYLYSGQTVELEEERNDFQQKELEHFFDIIEGKAENTNDILYALKTLQITKGEI